MWKCPEVIKSHQCQVCNFLPIWYFLNISPPAHHGPPALFHALLTPGKAGIFHYHRYWGNRMLIVCASFLPNISPVKYLFWRHSSKILFIYCAHTHTHKNQCSPFLPNLKDLLFCPISLITGLNYWSISWITDLLEHRTLQQDIPSPPGHSKSSSDSLIAFWIQLWVRGQSKNKLERILEFLARGCSGGSGNSSSPPCPSRCSATSFLSPVCNPTLSNLPALRGYGKRGWDYWKFRSNYTWEEQRGRATNTCLKITVLKISSTLSQLIPSAQSNKELQDTVPIMMLKLFF